MPEIAHDGPVFGEALDYLQGKVRLPTRTWTDLKEGAHARAFVVAGATTDALLADFQGALTQAIKEGRTQADFLKDFDAIVARHGWDYKGGRKWRARVIYNTNMRMAYSAGRWQQGQDLNDPIGRYVHIHSEFERKEHVAWNGLTLPLSDPWWRTHWPPNGWGCHCRVIVLPRREAIRRGWVIADQAPPVEMEDRLVNGPDGKETWPTPKGIDTGFGYNPGQSWLDGAVPTELREPLPPFGTPIVPPDLPPMHPPRPVPGMLAANLQPEDYIRAFLRPFGSDIGHPVAYRDAAGHRLAIGDELFTDRRGGWKVMKRGREREMPMLAESLIDPDEIWTDWADIDGTPVLRRRYLRSATANGRGGVIVFEWTAQGWTGVTAFPGEGQNYIDNQRRGVMLYRRK